MGKKCLIELLDAFPDITGEIGKAIDEKIYKIIFWRIHKVKPERMTKEIASANKKINIWILNKLTEISKQLLEDLLYKLPENFSEKTYGGMSL